MLVRDLRERAVFIAALVAAIAAALALTSTRAEAAPASPVLEFVAPSFPVAFTAEGGAVTAVLSGFDTVVHCDHSKGSGQITGPRSTLSSYVFTGCGTESGSATGRECQSAGAEPEEIRSGQIEADLVFINQLTHQVGMLLDPHGGVYLSFECGIDQVKAIGPFLSPVAPIDQLSETFTAVLDRVGSTQVPDQYEGPAGEPLAAVPTGERGTNPPVSTGVELGFTIHTAVPIQIKALSSADVELARLNDELTAQAARFHQEQLARDAAARVAAEQKLHEEAARAAATATREEELTQARHHARQVAKKVRQCRKLKPAAKRLKCMEKAMKTFTTRSLDADA